MPKSELYETSLRDVNGNTVDRDEPFSTQAARWLDDDNIDTLRINIDGVVLRLSKTTYNGFKGSTDAYIVDYIRAEVYG